MIIIQVIIGIVNTILGLVVILLKDYLADKRIIRSSFTLSKDKSRGFMGWFWSSPNELLPGRGYIIILILGLVITIIGLAVLITGILDIPIT